MLRKDFHYHLPKQLIAKYPLKQRSDSRLMVVEGQTIIHNKFINLIDYLNQEDLLIFNDTQVIPARIYGHKTTGGKIELLIEQILDNHTAIAHIKASKSPTIDSGIILAETITATIIGRPNGLFAIQLTSQQINWNQLLEQHGQIPLPPYLQRDPQTTDQKRYQTIYHRHPGAVAAPTAGLHFDQFIFDQLDQRKIKYNFITLHVGAGTFQPVRTKHIQQHQMHAEKINISQQLCNQINQTKANGGRIIAVGTTVVRALESCSSAGNCQPYQGSTNIFIYPGYKFNIIDLMITNFHLPESSLLMLVSAFIGHQTMMSAYQQAIEHKYRFYSYGDAMLLNPAITSV